MGRSGGVARHSPGPQEETMSPTGRPLQHLQSLGYAVKVVEKWNPFAKLRQDFFWRRSAGVETRQAGVGRAAGSLSGHCHLPSCRRIVRAAKPAELWTSTGNQFHALTA